MATTANDQLAPVYARLCEVLEEFDIAGEFSFDTELRADLDIDSAELVEIAAAATDGEAPDGKELSAVATIGQLVTLLDARNA